MSAIIRSAAITRPVLVYTTVATASALAALTPTPSFIPLVALLTSIRLAAWTFVHRPGGFVYGTTQAFFVALASAAIHLAPSLDALSTPNISLVIVSAITFITSCFAFIVVFAGCYAVRFTPSYWTQLTIFPALWASAWGFLSSVSPVGQLVTWSPVLGLGPYTWLRSVLGQWGVDWVTAAWSVLFSEVVGSWIVGVPDEQSDQQPLLADHSVEDYRAIRKVGAVKPWGDLSPRAKNLLGLVALLVALAVPSYTHPFLPLPLDSGTDVTPIAVGCVIPTIPFSRREEGLALDDYIKETIMLQDVAGGAHSVGAAFLLWPESAISFKSRAEKEDAFKKIQAIVQGKRYVGVGFEDVVPSDSAHGRAMKRNGLAVFTQQGLVLEYYKRNLVPIAESFSMIPGKEDPEVYTINMKAPKGYGPGWGPGPDHTRPVTLTGSICLDFASSSSFTSLETRPALTLAPAKTWHTGIGYAMWEQAKSRAAETGSTMLWCDGGVGGLSGIARGDYSEIVQRGRGSWYKIISLEYRFPEHRTVYTFVGQFGAFVIVWSAVGLGCGIPTVLLLLSGGQNAARSLMERLKAMLPSRRREHPLLDI